MAEILTIENLSKYEHLINRDDSAYDINMMIMPGTLEDKHKNIDPLKGIPAVRRQFNLIYLFTGGTHDLQLGANYCWLKPNDLVIVPENMVAASPHIERCSGYCSHFKTEFVKPLLNASLSEDFPYFDLEAQHIFHLDDQEAELIAQAFRDIISEHKRLSYESNFLLRNYLHILLLRVRDIYRVHLKKTDEVSSRSMQITNRFKHLAEKNFVEKRSVQEYAAMLNITPKHLSDVVKETVGKPPLQIIQDLLLLEAKVLLRSTDMTSSQIAHELRFGDQSHFSRFIKQRTGMSPQMLRKHL